MARFNKTVEKTVTKTVNYAGGEAFSQTAELELVSILLTSFVQKEDYYRSGSDTVKRMVELLGKVNPEFAAKAAVYARNEFGMRSITHVMAAEIAKYVSGQEWARKFYAAVIRRPDDITETLAYYMNQKNNKSLSKAMQRGFSEAFGKFDAYQLAKYRMEGKDVSLVDALNIIHPTPTERNGLIDVDRKDYITILEGKLESLKKNPKKNSKRISELSEEISGIKNQRGEKIKICSLEALTIGLLKNTKTWESKVSEAGQKAENDEEKADFKAEAWKSLIEKREIGYFALLKNLRNILQQAPDMTEKACALLTDEKLIAKSLVLPFRFMTALKEIEALGSGKNTMKVMVSLSEAVDIACKNVPKFNGETLVVSDLSGSMSSAIAGGSVSRIDVASLFAAIMAKANYADFISFGSRAKYLPVNPSDSTLTIANTIAHSNDNSSGKYYVDHGTDFHAMFKIMNKKYDRIFIFSDMQGWIGYHAPTSSFEAYKKQFGAKPNIYSIDLAGLGTMQFPQNQVYCLAGFSDKIFDLMKVLEQDRNALINLIKNYEF